MNLADVDALVKGLVERTSVFATADRYAAVNHGYRESARTIMDVKSDHFLFETGDFVIPAKMLRVALSAEKFPKGAQRIRKIVSLGADAGGAALQPQVYGGGGVSGYGAGPFPGGAAPPPASTASSGIVREWIPSHISSREFSLAELQPAMDCSYVLYDLLYPLGIPTLAIAPALATADLPLISVIYHPPRLVAPTDVVEPIIATHIELVVAWAMEWLLRATNDADSDRWGADADKLKSRLIQNVAPKVEQRTQALGSGMWMGGCDY